MEREPYYPDDLIAALATPWGQSALAVIRTSGPECIDVIAGLFPNSREFARAKGNSVVRGYLVNPKTGVQLDDLLAAVYRAPASYTGQDSVELFVHGSLPGIQAVLDALKSVGFRNASPGEFTFRAFLSKKMDLTRAEAVHEIVTAKSLKAQEMALHRLSGRIEEKISSIKHSLVEVMAAVELQLDYPEDEIEIHGLKGYTDVCTRAREEIEVLMATFRIGRVYQEGIRVAIAGRTNAGKSSLFNLFLKEDRSIVSETHGTTRDYIESWITIRGIPIRLYDTAGLREAGHPIEAEGMRRSGMVVDNAQVVLYLVDSLGGATVEDDLFLEEHEIRKNLVKVWNKTDLPGKPCPKGFLPVSSIHGDGFHRLEDEIVRIALGEEQAAARVVIDSRRQKDLLSRCSQALERTIEGIEENVPVDAVAVDLKEALDALGEITGEITSSDILETMFSRFCVGK